MTSTYEWIVIEVSNSFALTNLAGKVNDINVDLDTANVIAFLSPHTLCC